MNAIPLYLRVLVGAGACFAALIWALALCISGLLGVENSLDCLIWGSAFTGFGCAIRRGAPIPPLTEVRAAFFAYTCEALLLMGKAIIVYGVVLLDFAPPALAGLCALAAGGMTTHVFFPSALDRFLTAAAACAMWVALFEGHDLASGVLAAAVPGAAALYLLRKSAARDDEAPYGAGVACVLPVCIALQSGTALSAVAASALLATSMFFAGRSLALRMHAVTFLAALGAWYYETEMELAHKAALAFVTGGVMLAGGLMVRTRKRTSLHGARRAVLAGAVVPAMLFFTYACFRHEAALREGNRLLLALQPADPRGFLTGDYMALEYTQGHIPCDADGTASFQVNASDGVGQRTQQGAQAGVITVPCRMRGERSFPGPRSFFFKEGEAERYQKARYAILRVKDELVVLEDLADEHGLRLTKP